MKVCEPGNRKLIILLTVQRIFDHFEEITLRESGRDAFPLKQLSLLSLYARREAGIYVTTRAFKCRI